jgi:hypothetical protein
MFPKISSELSPQKDIAPSAATTTSSSRSSHMLQAIGFHRSLHRIFLNMGHGVPFNRYEEAFG